MNIIFFFCFFISYVYADLAKGVVDDFDDTLTTFKYDCLAANGYESVFIGSGIRNDININPQQYLAILQNKLNVELKLLLQVEDVVADTERPDIIIDRINGRLVAINITDPQHIWIDVDSLLVEQKDSDWVRQYFIDFTGYAANLQWTVGYFSTRMSWMLYTADWNLPSSKNQLLWDKDNIDMTMKLIPYGGWDNTSAVITNSMNQACEANLQVTSFDKTAFTSRVPVWLANGPTTPLVVSSTMGTTGSSLSSSTNTPSTNSTAAPANSTLSFSTASPASSASTLSSSSAKPTVASTSTVQPVSSTKADVASTKLATTLKPKVSTTSYESTTKTTSYLNLISSFLVSLIILGRPAY